MNGTHVHRHEHAGRVDHDHDHDHAHDLTATSDGRRRKLAFAFVLTTAMMIVEVIGGAWSGSLALLADAGHMTVDALALLLAVVGAWMATKPADAQRSYGYGRMEVLAGFVNALGQFVLVGWIAYEAIVRLLHPGEILSGVMLAVAIAGLLVNALVLRTLHGHAHDDVNLGEPFEPRDNGTALRWQEREACALALLSLNKPWLRWPSHRDSSCGVRDPCTELGHELGPARYPKRQSTALE